MDFSAGRNAERPERRLVQVTGAVSRREQQSLIVLCHHVIVEMRFDRSADVSRDDNISSLPALGRIDPANSAMSSRHGKP